MGSERMGVQHICIHNHKSKDIRNGCRGEQGQPLHRPLARHQQISCHSKRMGGHSESRHGSRCMEHSCRRMEHIHGIHIHVHKVQSSTPWVSLWISISLSSGLGNWLSLSLGNSFNGLSLGGSWSSSSGNNWGN